MAYLHRLTVVSCCLFFCFFASIALAVVPKSYEYQKVNGPWRSSPSAACADYGEGWTWQDAPGPRQGCTFLREWDQTILYGTVYSRLACPSNTTENGAGCSCNEGYIEQGNQCVVKPPPDPCEQLASMCEGSKGFTSQFETPGMNSSLSFLCVKPFTVPAIDPLPGCNKGCIANINGFAEANKTADGQWISKYNATYQSATCSQQSLDDLNSLNDPESTPVDIKDIKQVDPVCGGQKGVVNGVSVCLPYNASSGVVSKEVKDNGDGTKTTTKSEVTCENGKCATTTTSTTTNTTTNTTVSSSSSTTTVDKAAYCSQNKTAGVCKDEKGENEDGNGSFTGNCDSGFQCKGDAITCAIARKQHGDYCEALKSPEHATYVAAKAITGKVTADLPGNQTINLMDRFSDGDDFIGAGSCPPDRSISFIYGELVIPYSQLCPWFIILGDILVVVSCIAGARIIVARYS